MPFPTGRTVPIVAILVVSFSPSSVRGQTTVPAIGTTVVIKPGAVLKVGDRVVDTSKSPSIYQVQRAEGSWLWLTSRAISGWARPADVVPFDRAIYDTVVALVNRGKARQSGGDLERAIADYDEAIRLDPDNIPAHMNRGIARQARGDFDQAIADYDEAIVLGLGTAQAYNNRGHAWERKKDYTRAIADYTEAIRLGPGYLFSWINRGNARKAKGEFDKALADYETAVRLDPKSPWGYALQASIFAAPPDSKYRDGKKAVELASKATELAGVSDAFLCGVRADAHEAAGELDHAAEWRKAQEAASKAAGGKSVAAHAQVEPRQEKPDAQTSIGYLSSIPADYVGAMRASRVPVQWRHAQQAPVYQQPGSGRQQMQGQWERDRQAADRLWLMMQQRLEQELMQKQERNERLQHPFP